LASTTTSLLGIAFCLVCFEVPGMHCHDGQLCLVRQKQVQLAETIGVFCMDALQYVLCSIAQEEHLLC